MSGEYKVFIYVNDCGNQLQQFYEDKIKNHNKKINETNCYTDEELAKFLKQGSQNSHNNSKSI